MCLVSVTVPVPVPVQSSIDLLFRFSRCIIFYTSNSPKLHEIIFLFFKDTRPTLAKASATPFAERRIKVKTIKVKSTLRQRISHNRDFS